jgi:predicted nucleotidyltransferase
MTWRTIDQRRGEERVRLQAALGSLRATLTVYAAAHGGRFVLYGSAARGGLRCDSDVDIVVDFSADQRDAAMDFLEADARRLDLRLDARSADFVSRRFLDDIVAGGEVFS